MTTLKKLAMTSRAFTLIELLVVVLIIGILAAIALPQYQKSVEKSRAVEGIMAVKTITQSAQRHKLATGQWPSKFDDLDIEYSKLTGVTGNLGRLSDAFSVYLNYANYEYPLLDRMSGGRYRYTIIWCPKDNSLWCGAGGAPDSNIENEKALCENLGGVQKTLPAGCATSRAINYKL
jgi:prepilin-type N-terminal cleavage/methylation domain-containing protein